MNDSQLPRYHVFLQISMQTPHLEVVTVHAPDQELALQNARDVFVCRPECVSLWVVPASQITTWTAEELKAQAVEQSDAKTTWTSQEEESFHVFWKIRHSGSYQYAGQVVAHSPAHALRAARGQPLSLHTGLAWLVFPARAVYSSTPQDYDSLIAPVLHKPFRQATDFHTLTAMPNLIVKSSARAHRLDSSETPAQKRIDGT